MKKLLKSVGDFIKSAIPENHNKILEYFEESEYNIKHLKNSLSNYAEFMGWKIEYYRNLIKIHVNINSEIIIQKQKPKCIEIPYDKSDTYKTVDIWIDNRIKIKDVSILGGEKYHPNCDSKGFYCLGEIRNQELNVESLSTLISNISIYNLLDCHKITKNIIATQMEVRGGNVCS